MSLTVVFCESGLVDRTLPLSAVQPQFAFVGREQLEHFCRAES